MYVDPYVWVWRVTCPAGAYVREGLDLNTQHTDTLPYGSLIRVTRRTLNAQGLSRLRVHSILVDNNNNNTKRQGTQLRVVKNKNVNNVKPRWVDGWCSEFLNPLSGQRGIVAQPLPFPVPARYRVTLSLGAVIRSDIELSSPQIGISPMGAIVTIVARAFSEHPVDKCIERLQLAGNGGWISVRLNRPPPMDDLIVELVGIDANFRPENDNAGTYHMEALRAVEASQHELEPQPSHRYRSMGDISSVDESSSSAGGGASDDTTDPNNPNPLDTTSPKTTTATSATTTTYHPRSKSALATWRHGPDAGRCLICLTEERNATIVHGETGHVACCLVCARILKARGDKVRQRVRFGSVMFGWCRFVSVLTVPVVALRCSLTNDTPPSRFAV
jgi:hypothetical protein